MQLSVLLCNARINTDTGCAGSRQVELTIHCEERTRSGNKLGIDVHIPACAKRKQIVDNTSTIHTVLCYMIGKHMCVDDRWFTCGATTAIRASQPWCIYVRKYEYRTWYVFCMRAYRFLPVAVGLPRFVHSI